MDTPDAEPARATAAAAAADAAGAAAPMPEQAAPPAMRAAAPDQSRLVQGAAEELEKAGRGLAGLAEETAAGMRRLMATMSGFGAGGAQRDAQRAMARLVEGVAAANMRFADELLRRAGPSAVVELQRRFLRGYFDALTQGGALPLRAAGQAAEQSLRAVEAAVEAGERDAEAAVHPLATPSGRVVQLEAKRRPRRVAVGGPPGEGR
jgi:hypothetical protein